ncbi:MAG: hypothetical protein RR733_05355, partial [Victivallaceae bacterium]
DYINIGAFLFAFLGFGIPVLALIKQSNDRSDKRDREFNDKSDKRDRELAAQMSQRDREFNTHIAEFNQQMAQRDREFNALVASFNSFHREMASEWIEFRREFFKKD